MNGIDENTIVVQIKSLMVYEFLNEYNKLEYLIREIFERNIHSLPTNVIQQLYFFYGGRIGSYIDTEGETVMLTSVKYKENDVFKELTVNQIIKIFKKILAWMHSILKYNLYSVQVLHSLFLIV